MNRDPSAIVLGATVTVGRLKVAKKRTILRVWQRHWTVVCSLHAAECVKSPADRPIGINRMAGRKRILVITGVQRSSEAYLVHVIEALRHPHFDLTATESRQQHSGKD